MEPFIGLISVFPYNWAPVNWASCMGQPLQSQQYQALYGLIGVTYGGNPQNFNLPNLCGRTIVGGR